MGGEIDLLFDVVNIAMGLVKSGRVRAIASTAPRRGAGPLGELPVMAEAIPGFELVTWHGVMVAPATPRPLLQRLNREFITGGPPEEFAAVLKRDYDKYGTALRAAGVKPE